MSFADYLHFCRSLASTSMTTKIPPLEVADGLGRVSSGTAPRPEFAEQIPTEGCLPEEVADAVCRHIEEAA